MSKEIKLSERTLEDKVEYLIIQTGLQEGKITALNNLSNRFNTVLSNIRKSQNKTNERIKALESKLNNLDIQRDNDLKHVLFLNSESFDTKDVLRELIHLCYSLMTTTKRKDLLSQLDAKPKICKKCGKDITKSWFCPDPDEHPNDFYCTQGCYECKPKEPICRYKPETCRLYKPDGKCGLPSYENCFRKAEPKESKFNNRYEELEMMWMPNDPKAFEAVNLSVIKRSKPKIKINVVERIKTIVEHWSEGSDLVGHELNELITELEGK